MKATTLITALLLITTCLFAQTRLNGDWVKYSDNGKISFMLSIDGFMIIHTVMGEDGKTISMYDKNINKGMDFDKVFQQNNLNGVYSWTNTCDDCVWTETQIYQLSMLSDDVIYYHWLRVVNNNSGLDCFKTGGDCFSDSGTGYLYRDKTK